MILELLKEKKYHQAVIGVQKYLKTNSKKTYLKNMKRFAIENKNAIGTPTPYIRKISKIIIKFGKEHPDEALKFCRILWKANIYENKKIVSFVLGSLAKSKSNEIIPMLRKMLSESKDWSICDSLSGDVVRYLLEVCTNEVLSEFRKWVNDENLWVRRGLAASVAYYSITHKNGFRKEFNELLEKMRRDKEYYVRKAVEWAYREMK